MPNPFLLGDYKGLKSTTQLLVWIRDTLYIAIRFVILYPVLRTWSQVFSPIM